MTTAVNQFYGKHYSNTGSQMAYPRLECERKQTLSIVVFAVYLIISCIVIFYVKEIGYLVYVCFLLSTFLRMLRIHTPQDGYGFINIKMSRHLSLFL